MSEISREELKEIYAFAIQLGRDAGDMLLSGVERRCNGGDGGDGDDEMVEKINAVDIVTKMDNDVEAFIKESIERRYPGHKFIGEETYSKGGAKDYLIGDEPTWCVDPLDGTVNYTHLFPMFCVSIAFIHHSIPTIGVIYAPMLNTIYCALKNHGAYTFNTISNPSLSVPPFKTNIETTSFKRLPLINNPVPVLGKAAPKGCVFSCEWGKDRKWDEGNKGNLWRKTESFVNMAVEVGGRGGKGGMVHGVRSLGSATLDLAYVASGAFDIWWEGGCWEWDVAAGICILQESGGLVTSANPPPNPATDPIEEVRLGSRLYLAIRPAGDSEDETGRQAQERVVREVWKRVETLGYERPGA